MDATAKSSFRELLCVFQKFTVDSGFHVHQVSVSSYLTIHDKAAVFIAIAVYSDKETEGKSQNAANRHSKQENIWHRTFTYIPNISKSRIVVRLLLVTASANWPSA